MAPLGLKDVRGYDGVARLWWIISIGVGMGLSEDCRELCLEHYSTAERMIQRDAFPQHMDDIERAMTGKLSFN